MNSKGVLLVISGPSGCGKGTVLGEFLKNRENVFVSVSATTREPRPGEINGKHYYFISKSEFESRIENDGMLEYASYCGNYYGTPREEVYKKLNGGQDVILEIEVQGAKQIKEKCPEAVLVFVAPPSMNELRQRLTGRGTEDETTVLKRLETAQSELKAAYDYDYIIINDDVENAANRLSKVIEASRYKITAMKQYIDEVLNYEQTEC